MNSFGEALLWCRRQRLVLVLAIFRGPMHAVAQAQGGFFLPAETSPGKVLGASGGEGGRIVHRPSRQRQFPPRVPASPRKRAQRTYFASVIAVGEAYYLQLTSNAEATDT